jgi:2-dehydropantoate 2-reductase
MRIAIVGAGAIGGYLGGWLSAAGEDVTFIARGANLDAIAKHGMRVIGEDGVEVVSKGARAVRTMREAGPQDSVLLTVKAHQVAPLAEDMHEMLTDGTTIVTMQNGIPWWYFHKLEGPYEGRRIEAVDPDGEVSRVIPPDRAIGCVVFAGTELAEPGVVEHLEGTRFSIGEPDGSVSERCRQFSEAMVAGGLKCPVEERLRDEIWVKLMGNVAFNPLSVLSRTTLAEMCRHAPTRALVASIMEEALEIATAVGAEPSVSIEQRLEGAEKVGDHKPSTLQDLEAGKPLELAAIVDSVVELADLTGVPAPSLRAVSAASGLLAETLGLR